MPTSKRVVVNHVNTASKLKAEDILNGLIWNCFKDALGNKQMEIIGLGILQLGRTVFPPNKSPPRPVRKPHIHSSFFLEASVPQRRRFICPGLYPRGRDDLQVPPQLPLDVLAQEDPDLHIIPKVF